MKNRLLLTSFALTSLILGGCNTADREARITNPRQPGPAVGAAVGVAAGAVVSNVTGAVVGVGEGAAAAAKSTFTNERRVVRTWRTETTADGRTIQVPVEIEVDADGHPIAEKKS
jgi:hypothetical protein